MRIAFISGTSIVNSPLFSSWEVRSVETKHGTVTYKEKDGRVLLNRHGFGTPLPPHTINHRANLRAIADLGFTNVVSLNSVGSLKTALPPGSLVSCADYVALQQGPATYFDDELKGAAPGIANNLIPLIVEKLAPDFRVIKDWGDVVGMTLAHEADLCTELGLNYNSLAIVDNYANGLEGTEIDFAKFKHLVRENQSKVNRLFTRLLEISQ
jgi:5'-methylthioadenosine phosphorylase